MAKRKEESEWEKIIRAACREWPDSPHSLAKAAGIDHAQLHRFMAGQQSIGLVNAEKLCGQLGLVLTASKQGKKKS
jgi:hypothetical protein